MSPSQEPPPDPLFLERQIDKLCSEFEAAWKAGQAPRIEDYLARVPDEAHAQALKELIAQEVDLRRAAGESVEPVEYRERFPDYGTQVDAAFAMLADRQAPDAAPAETDPFDSDGEQDADEEPMPERIGRYVIKGRLGKGGFGIVYLAHDSDLGRLVALKAPRASRFSSQDQLERFVAEARTAAQLEPPRIVTIYDILRDADRVVIVQQYIEGQDLARRLKSGPLSAEQAADLTASIAETIAVAHQKGFVHRDIKPSNILLNKEGQPYVADFGLAIHEDIQRRRRGETSGTPAYMSPEQIRGETHRLDGRSDIWSLGVILYETLTGQRPFTGETRLELFDEIKHRNPKPPRMIKPTLPAELERICLKCLSRRPAISSTRS